MRNVDSTGVHEAPLAWAEVKQADLTERGVFNQT